MSLDDFPYDLESQNFFQTIKRGSIRFNVYNAFGVRNIFRGSQGGLAYHPSPRQMRFGTKIWVSRRYGKSSIQLDVLNLYTLSILARSFFFWMGLRYIAFWETCKLFRGERLFSYATKLLSRSESEPDKGFN